MVDLDTLLKDGGVPLRSMRRAIAEEIALSVHDALSASESACLDNADDLARTVATVLDFIGIAVVGRGGHRAAVYMSANTIALDAVLKSGGVKTAGQRATICGIVATTVQGALASCGASCLDNEDDLTRVTATVLESLGIPV